MGNLPSETALERPLQARLAFAVLFLTPFP